MLSNEDKAEKRLEVQKRRQANAMAKSLLPIAYKQARSVASHAGVDMDDLTGYAILGIATAMQKAEYQDGRLRPGFYRFAKLSARGYCLNYLRDKSRTVRLPRDLTLAYLSEQKALRTVPGFRELCDIAKAEYLGLDVDVLIESRSAIALSDKDISNYDASYAADASDDLLQTAAEHVQAVLDAGIKAVAAAGKLDQTAVSEQFYKALKTVLEAKDNA